jgi:N-acetylglucosaminyldiphosphoundecaprenol N-acetyl-beta-D-mannosaminyltransferase
MAVVNILGVAVDQVNFPSAIEQIASFIDHGRPHQVVTINPEFVMRAQGDRAFRKVLDEADLAVPDGAGLLWASRILARHKSDPKHQAILTERVTGTDLLPALAARAEKEGWRIFLLGGRPGVADRTATILKIMHPKLHIVGAEGGPLLTEEGKPLQSSQNGLLEATLAHVRKSRPQILFAAFGAPKQDRFIARYKKELGVPVMIGVGGAFDFISGAARRAPTIFRFLWLEWFWRLILEPWRFARIWTAVVRFPFAVLFSKVGRNT